MRISYYNFVSGVAALTPPPQQFSLPVYEVAAIASVLAAAVF